MKTSQFTIDTQYRKASAELADIPDSVRMWREIARRLRYNVSEIEEQEQEELQAVYEGGLNIA